MAPTGTWYIRLIQYIWDTGEVTTKMLLTIIMLVLKGTSGDFRGIGLLEVVWKIVERIIDARLMCAPLHKAVHGFRPGCGCSTGEIMQLKLAQ